MRAPLRILGSVVEQGSQGLHPCFPFEGYLEGREQTLKQGRNKARSVRTEVKKKGASGKRAGKKMKSAKGGGKHVEKNRFEGRKLWGRMWER